MRSSFRSVCLVACCIAGPMSAATSSDLLRSLPLRFDQNLGQADAATHYVARGKGYTLAVAKSQVLLKLRSKKNTDTVRMRLLATNPDSEGAPFEPLGSHSNYLRGNDPE